MSWLKRVTGIQELINGQIQTNLYLSELVYLNRPKPKPKGPAIKNYK